MAPPHLIAPQTLCSQVLFWFGDNLGHMWFGKCIWAWRSRRSCWHTLPIFVLGAGNLAQTSVTIETNSHDSLGREEPKAFMA